MKHFQLFVFLAVFLAAHTVIYHSEAQEAYTWDNVIVGGGGYVTGILAHPQEPNLRYIRTDIGGMFRWDEPNKRWVQLFGSFDPERDNLYGVDGFALDPNNTDVIYAALGKYSLSESGIFKSEDRGKSWRKLKDEPFAGNWKFREVGENLIVDPNNSKVVYCGTRLNGLIKSTDGGENWSKVNSVPNGYVGDATNYWDQANNPIGVRSVHIDQATGTVYTAVYRDGVYQSTDNGNNFSKIAGSPSDVLRVVAAPGNLLYTTTENGVYTYDQTAWKKLPIVTSGYDLFNGFAVDPFNDNNLFTVTGEQLWYQRAYRSTDKGETWEEVYSYNDNVTIHDNTWHAGINGFFHAASAAVTFDPHKEGTIYVTDWYQLWRCENIFDEVTDWYNDVAGHEEIVVLALASSPTGTSLFSGQGDVVGFKHYDQNEVPVERLTDKAECTGIDFSEKDPSKMALVSSSDWYGKDTEIFTSNDFGDNFNPVNIPAGGTNGKIAVASNDGSNLVYVWGASIPHYSTDGGNTWNASQGGPSQSLLTTYMYQYDDPLIASKDEDNTFYIVERSTGKLFKSTDSGATWNVIYDKLPPATSGSSDILQRETVNISSGWGAKSKVMLLSLSAKGLWISTDAGASFTENTYFEIPLMSSLGKGSTADGNPAMYVYGKHQGQWGIYLSDDLGSSWRRINDNDNLVGNSPTMMKGDRQVYGKVYVGSNGSGLFYGAPTEGGATNQPDPVSEFTEGVYELHPVSSPDKVVAVSEDNVELASDGNQANQRWQITKRENGYYRLTSAADAQQCLDAAGWGTDNGTNVHTWGTSLEGQNNQEWKLVLEDETKGYYSLAPRHTEEAGVAMRLDVSENSTEAGANMQLWTSNGGANQRFVLEKISGENARLAGSADKGALTTAEDVVAVYPNPTSGTDFMVSGVSQESTLRLYNVQGQQMSVRVQAVDGQRQQVVPRRPLPKGIYLLRAHQPDGSSVEQKLVVE